MRSRAGQPLALLVFCAALAAGCTGGSETNAAQEQSPEAAEAAAAERHVDARQALERIHEAIPVYQGAKYRDDLTRRDEVMIRNRYGAGAKVFTLATNDSYPQVFHYYTTYLAQFRAFPAQPTYPSGSKEWRTLEVKLNDAMQDPFIPGESLDPRGEQVTLQIAETEAEPKTVIRYIVTPPPPAAPAVAATAAPPAAPAAPAPQVAP